MRDVDSRAMAGALSASSTSLRGASARLRDLVQCRGGQHDVLRGTGEEHAGQEAQAARMLANADDLWSLEPDGIAAAILANLTPERITEVFHSVRMRMTKPEQPKGKRRRNIPDDVRRQLDAKKAGEAKTITDRS